VPLLNSDLSGLSGGELYTGEYRQENKIKNKSTQIYLFTTVMRYHNTIPENKMPSKKEYKQRITKSCKRVRRKLCRTGSNKI
jgi:hypothetical protein